MTSLKLDLHIHSIYSSDSLITPGIVLKYAKLRGLNGLAITDHNTLKAYNILKRKNRNNDLLIIPGMEINTNIGEIISLFIETEIKTKDNNFFVLVEKIKENNGLIIIPHPFDILRKNRLKLTLLSDNVIKKYIDGIEIINSRIIFKRCIEEARVFNNKYHLFETGGSDAHTKNEIGKAYTIIENTSNLSIESVRNSLITHKSMSEGNLSPAYVHMFSIMNKLRKGLYI